MAKPLLTKLFLRAFNLGLSANAALTRSRARWVEQRGLTPADLQTAAFGHLAIPR